MALNFPASPSTGDVHNASNGLQYHFDGVKWISQGAYNTSTINTLNFTQQGTGAVSRSVQNKLEEFVSVKDFGAKGDGTTDDATAIQAALDFVGARNSGGTTGGTVYMPAGIYQIKSTLKIQYSNVKLQGAGKVQVYIRRHEFAADSLLIEKTTQVNQEVNNITVEGITFLDNASAYTSGNSTPMTGAHIVVNNITTGQLHDLDITNGQAGIRIYGGADISIMNVTCLGKFDSSQHGWNSVSGVALFNSETASPKLATQIRAYDLRIGTSGGQIKGWQYGLLIKGAEDVGFTECYFGNCTLHNVLISQASDMDVQILEIMFGSGCYIDGAGSHAVLIDGSGAGGANYIGNVKFVGSDIKGQGGDSLDGIHVQVGHRSGLYDESVRGLIINGCTVSGQKRHGIYLGSVIDTVISDCHICGNNYFGTTTGSQQNGSGVVIHNDANNVNIDNNLIGRDSQHRKPGDTGYAGYQIYGVDLGSTVNHVAIANNNLENNVTGPINTTNTSNTTKITDNYGYNNSFVTGNGGSTIPNASAIAIPNNNAGQSNTTGLVNPVMAPCMISAYGGNGVTVTLNGQVLAAGVASLVWNVGPTDTIKLTFTTANFSNWVWWVR